MELKIISMDGNEEGKCRLPSQFSEPLRQGLIKRAVEAIQSHMRQKYGADPRAGKKASAKLSKRRRKFKGSYGKGIARVGRKTMTRRGTQFNWVGAFATQTVGGHRAHPPVVEKILEQKINDKERKKALRSALAAVVSSSIVSARGHKIPANYPFAAAQRIENISETAKIEEILVKLGFEKEIARCAKRKIRAGIGKLRGRKYKLKSGILVVVSQKCPLVSAARNIPGVDICEARNLNAKLLAPGGIPGRITLFTDAAIAKIEKEKMFN